jgi:2-dehydro-3-deoxyphosphooctonate aldolase (KDO 8-P synthase)
LIEAVAETGKPLNIKKGQFLAPIDMFQVINKAKGADVILTERGTCFGHHDLVVDFRGFVQMAETGRPIVFDASHSVQLPGGNRGCSGGMPEFIPSLSRAAIACEADGIFMEVHPYPDIAKCDSSSSFRLEEVPALLRSLVRIEEALRSPCSREVLSV